MDGKGSKPYEHTAITQHYLNNINANSIHLDGKAKRPSRHDAISSATQVKSTDRLDNSIEADVNDIRQHQTLPDDYDNNRNPKNYHSMQVQI